MLWLALRRLIAALCSYSSHTLIVPIERANIAGWFASCVVYGGRHKLRDVGVVRRLLVTGQRGSTLRPAETLWAPLSEWVRAG